ncbi:hypothetical protein QQP08_007182 [Theobroma cacao]|nr:hypothetical protein QQP08_007182 [Theobroma cacao]
MRCDRPVTVYKGYSLTKNTEEYLPSCGLKNVKEDLFGVPWPWPFQVSIHVSLHLNVFGEPSIQMIGKEGNEEKAPSVYLIPPCVVLRNWIVTELPVDVFKL